MPDVRHVGGQGDADGVRHARDDQVVARDAQRDAEQGADRAQDGHRRHRHHRDLPRRHPDGFQHAQVTSPVMGVEDDRVEDAEGGDQGEQEGERGGRADDGPGDGVGAPHVGGDAGVRGAGRAGIVGRIGAVTQTHVVGDGRLVGRQCRQRGPAGDHDPGVALHELPDHPDPFGTPAVLQGDPVADPYAVLAKEGRTGHDLAAVARPPAPREHAVQPRPVAAAPLQHHRVRGAGQAYVDVPPGGDRARARQPAQERSEFTVAVLRLDLLAVLVAVGVHRHLVGVAAGLPEPGHRGGQSGGERHGGHAEDDGGERQDAASRPGERQSHAEAHRARQPAARQSALDAQGAAGAWGAARADRACRRHPVGPQRGHQRGEHTDTGHPEQGEGVDPGCDGDGVVEHPRVGAGEHGTEQGPCEQVARDGAERAAEHRGYGDHREVDGDDLPGSEPQGLQHADVPETGDHGTADDVGDDEDRDRDAEDAEGHQVGRVRPGGAAHLVLEGEIRP